MDRIDPDGTLGHERTQHAEREVGFQPVTGGGAKIHGYLTPLCAEILRSVLDPLAAPRPETDPRGNTIRDQRSTGQRHHDALYDACHRLLQTGTLPANGGTPATMLITISLEALTTGLGLGRTSNGEYLTARQCLHLAAEARLIPVILDTNGVPLHLGRSRRLASEAQCHA